MIKAQLIHDEGKRRSAYKDHLGYITIGVGRMIDERKGGGLSDDEIMMLLDNDIRRIEQQLKKNLWFTRLNSPRQGAIINMAFQLGVQGLMGFHNMISAINRRDWKAAEKHGLDSKWARQDTPERAKRVMRQIRTGKWEYS